MGLPRGENVRLLVSFGSSSKCTIPDQFDKEKTAEVYRKCHSKRYHDDTYDQRNKEVSHTLGQN